MVSVAEQDQVSLNSLPAGGDVCGLLVIFASSLDQDQAWQDVENDLDNVMKVFWNFFSEKLILI